MNAVRTILVALLVLGCGGAAAPPTQSAAPSVISGTVTFHGPYIGHKDCHGVGAFADMAAGTDILVLDGAGTTIGKGDLSVLEGSGDDGCIFGFTSEVPDVPFYTFKIGDRDGPTFSLADMKSQGWKVELTVGK